MGWDINLILSDGEIAQVKPHQTGSNRRAALNEDGQLITIDHDEASCCVTYNYSEVYRLVGFHMKDINGKTGKETIPILEQSIEKLGTKSYDDYWAPTPGNAGIALVSLLNWAKEHPDGIWKVT